MAEPEPPEWNEDTFHQYRQKLMDRFQCSEEDAANRLQDLIQGLLENPRSQAPNTPPPPLPESPTPPTPPRNSGTHEKKIDFPDFDLDKPVADQIPHTPSQYAVGKIKNLEYVKLWYFTTEGCKETSKATPTAADDTFGILNTESGLALQPIKATKASRNAVTDEHLSWEQIMTARHTLISTTNRTGWPQKHTLALAEFYIRLEGLKAAGYNPRALILYQAVVRRQWHEALRQEGLAFNLSLINENLLSKLENQIRDRDQEEILKKASTTPPPPNSRREQT